MSSEENDYLEDNNENFFDQRKRALIFLIDCRQPMFTKDFVDDEGKERTRFNVALKCCRTVIINKIIAKEKDLVGIVLLGTDNPDSKTKTKHVAQLLDLNYPNAESIIKLDKWLNDSDSKDVLNDWGSSEMFILADALWYCSTLFSHSGNNISEKRILLFTYDDDPHVNDSEKAHMARKRAKDLNLINITLELLPMKPDFNYSLFFKELVEIVNGASNTDLVQSSNRLEELLERVNRLNFNTRRYAKLKWDLGKGVYIGISLYTMYSETNILSQESLNRTTNEPVKRMKQLYDPQSYESSQSSKATGDLLLSSDIEEYVTIAGQDIVFSNENKATIKKIMEPGMTLLGFKSHSVVSEKLHSSTASFMFPEETLIKGSQQLFKALVDRCIANNVVPLCCLTPRNRATTKYVLLLPSIDDGTTPFGFHIFYLPFHNEIKEQRPEKSISVDENVIEMAKKVINKLRFSYKPTHFQNPKIQNFWTHLEALALEYSAPIEGSIQDNTVVPVHDQDERLDGLADEFNKLCGLNGTHSSHSAASKRQLSESTSSAKRVKMCTSADDYFQEIKDAIHTNTVDKFTVVKLKEFLLAHNKSVKAAMKKADLVNAVYNLNL